MKRLLLISFAIAFFVIHAQCQDMQFKPAFSVVMHGKEAQILLNQWSRSTPEEVKSYWNPADSDIASLESNFKKLYNLTWHIAVQKIDSLDKFGFQYAGIIINGEKFIYINAFPLNSVKELKQLKLNPAKTPVMVCDGGPSFWGAVFNIKTKEFSMLAFNGYA
jgi:hypothetical protein